MLLNKNFKAILTDIGFTALIPKVDEIANVDCESLIFFAPEML